MSNIRRATISEVESEDKTGHTTKPTPESRVPTVSVNASTIGSAQKVITPPQQIIDRTLAEMFETLKGVERKNGSTLYDKQFPEAHLIIMKVDRPTASQIGSMRNQLTEALKAFPQNSAAWRQLYGRGEQFIEDNMLYPKANKLLQITSRTDGTLTRFVEFYANNENALAPREDGSMTIRVSYNRQDMDFGGPDSWAAKRYGHLFSIEEKDIQRVPPSSEPAK